MAMNEKAKMLPFADVWNEYLRRENMSDDYYGEIEKYEQEVLLKR